MTENKVSSIFKHKKFVTRHAPAQVDVQIEGTVWEGSHQKSVEQLLNEARADVTAAHRHVAEARLLIDQHVREQAEYRKHQRRKDRWVYGLIVLFWVALLLA